MTHFIGQAEMKWNSDAFQNATEKEKDIQDRATLPEEKSTTAGAVENENPESLNEKTQGAPGNSLVVRAGLEPATHGFSVRCSTN